LPTADRSWATDAGDPVMKNREPRLPLVVGLIAALLAHGGLLPWATHWLTGFRAKRSGQTNRMDVQPPKQLELGRDVPKTSAVAWIPYDDFRKLIAPQSPTEQPALQQQANPTPNAPLPVDPSPSAASPVTPTHRDIGQSVDNADVSQPQKAKTTQAEAIQEPADPRQQQSPIDEGIDHGQLAMADTGDRVELERSPTPDQDQPPARSSMAAPSQPSQPSPHQTRQEQDKPTSAARSDRESSPTTLQPDRHEIKPGRVITSDGIEIRTVQPRFSMVTRVSTLPNNPVARLVFDPRDGSVIDVKLIQSSGYPNVDGPVLASLYKWRAVGKRLADYDKPFDLTIQVVLGEY